MAWAIRQKIFLWLQENFRHYAIRLILKQLSEHPGFAGFQLLQLHDFPGQGTALVGILNPFFESKGYITPEEFRMFCNQQYRLPG